MFKSFCVGLVLTGALLVPSLAGAQSQSYVPNALATTTTTSTTVLQNSIGGGGATTTSTSTTLLQNAIGAGGGTTTTTTTTALPNAVVKGGEISNAAPAYTGSNLTGPLVGLSALLVAVGGVLVVSNRRRRPVAPKP